MRFKKILLGLLLICFLIQGCEKWEDHTGTDDKNLTVNLLEEIKSRSNLSKFAEYLQKSGLDKELSSSKTYTVWAPVNDALQNIDPAIAGDSAKLRNFLSNHISLQSYFVRDAQATLRVPMLNGKRVFFTGAKFDEATILEADKYVADGVLHIIDKSAPVLPNGWELITTTTYQQNAFLVSLNSTFQDPALAVIDSISVVTGLPIYKPGTGLVTRNTFTSEVHDLKNEEKLYTYFILNDAAFTTETNKLKPYYKTGTADSTTNLASFSVLKDLAVEGLYTISQLPDTLISKFGVKIPIDKNKITETKRLSNGIAYVMSEINFSAKNKIPTIIIQGENPLSFSRLNGDVVNVRTNTFYRIKTNPISRQLFTDIFIYNHGIAELKVQYQARNLASVKYKVYWTTLNDTIIVSNLNPGTRLPVAFNQRLAMGSRTATNFANVSVLPNVYAETLLGEYTQSSFGTLDMFLTAANSTATGANTVTLDYIKLVPDIP